MLKIGNYTVEPDFLYYDLYIWASRETDNELMIGLTDYGQAQLKDIISLELPIVGQRLGVGKEIVKIESISRDYSLKSPVSCIVQEINKNVKLNPEQLNEKPFRNWIIRVEVVDLGGLDKLIEGEDMADLIQEEVGMESHGSQDSDMDEDFDYESEFKFDSSDDYYNDNAQDSPYVYDEDDY